MSIEQTLERIAVGIEKLIAMQGGQAPAIATTPVSAPVTAPVTAPAPQMPGPSGIGPGQAVPPVAQAPVAEVPVSYVAPAPVAQAPVAQAAQPNTSILDQARDAANQFHRAHPERAGEIWAVITQVGGDTQGGFNSIPAGREQEALQKIQALGA